MASPFFFVSKKDAGKLRPCQDYWYLNEWTIKNAYPLPLISEIIDKLKGARYFTKLDIRWGYNNIRIKKGDEWKAAFKTNCGLYKPMVMFFGMCNSPATFQAMMDSIFDDMISNSFIIVYMDDMFIFEKDLSPLITNTRSILWWLQDNNLYLKLSKCEFHKMKIKYLGMIIEEGRISMDTSKLKVLNISEYCSIIFSLLSYQHYYIILTFFFSQRFTYMSQLSTWSWDMSSSLIYGINHTNIYVELDIGNCTQYLTFYLKLRQLAIGLATKYFNKKGSKTGTFLLLSNKLEDF